LERSAMSQFHVGRAAVLGAGTMGSRIAAHLANAGIPSLLLDIAPKELNEDEKRRGLTLDSREVHDRIVKSGWKATLAAKPPALFSPELASLVTTGNFTDSLSCLGDVDWIIEAVTENLEIKRALLEQVVRYRKPGTIVSSNSSGIPMHRIVVGFTEDLRRHFLGTHFFNPPRHMKLLELVPTPDTDPELLRFMARFGEDQLGKGTIICKDTPSFIANRIGTYGVCCAVQAMLKQSLTLEEVDILTGPALGRPKTATFRTLDIVGLDVFAHVVRNLHENLIDDPEREIFKVPPFIEWLLQNGRVGEKAGQGFYKRARGQTQSEIQYLDYGTMEYRPVAHPRLAVVDRAAALDDSRKKLRALVKGTDREAKFLWQVVSSTLCYAAARIPEISDDIVSVDNAMKWGFLHGMGPFETWDALGVVPTVERLRKEGRSIPSLVENLLSSGRNSFYRKRAGRNYAFAPASTSYAKLEDKPGLITLRSIKDKKKIVVENQAASLLDLGDGVACLEFHTKMNTIDGNVLQLMGVALDEVERNFVGMVIANEGANFSAGANLFEILKPAKTGQWNAIEQAIRTAQGLNMRLRYSTKPVVVAPHGLTLGGACEITMHGDLVRADSELYIGLVEMGVGLIPAAGGCKAFVMRAAEKAASGSDMDLFPRIREVFELIGMAKVSSSALEARHLGFLRREDRISLNGARRIQAAKEDVLALARDGYRPPSPRNDIPVLGEPGLTALKMGLHLMERGGYISAYDKVVGTHLARVITGGSHIAVSKVSEQYLLDLEREAFLSLCGQAKTQERMEYMLKEGKPLRN
jgi:3-hydroxyacyl-CoA dehydrogenase